MAIPVAENLLASLGKGEKLNTNDRRHCVAYLMATAPVSNVELARMFDVSEGTIRADKKIIREERAKSIKQDDIALVIADINLCLEKQMADIEASKRRCKQGTRSYLDHCKAIFSMQVSAVQALQNLGFYPKNLGNMTVERFDWKATVAKDGAVSTVAAPEGIQEADFEVIEPVALPPPSNEEIEDIYQEDEV